MAGGWSKRGSGVPLSDRVRAGESRELGERPRVADDVDIDLDECPAKHCWVSDAVDRQGVKRPGLLVEWRQGEQGWEGRVVYAAQVRADGWLLVEEWVSAGLLSPG